MFLGKSLLLGYAANSGVSPPVVASAVSNPGSVTAQLQISTHLVYICTCLTCPILVGVSQEPSVRCRRQMRAFAPAGLAARDVALRL